MKKVLSLMAVLLFLAFPIHATVTDTESPVKVYTSGAVTAYPIPFDYIDDEDIEVKLYVPATGATVTQTINVDYTIVSDTVTYSAAPGSAYHVILKRVTPFTQEGSWVAGSAPPLSAWESAFDKITYLTQDLNERLGRSILQPESATYRNLTMPDPVYNAGRLLRFNASGNGLEAIATLAAGYALDVTAYCDAYDLQVLHNHTYMPIGYLRRSKFTYTGTMTFTIGPGVYDIVGAAGGWRSVFWSSDLTITNTYTDSGWYYLYIDDSAAAVDAPRELGATDFICSATAPSWSNAKQGWYNGDDRCIFAYNVRTSVIRPFCHDGGEYVQHTISSSDRASADLTAAVEVPVKLPAFSTRGKFTLSTEMDGARLVWIAGGGFLNYTNLGYGISGATVYFPLFDFYTSADQKLTIALADYTGTNNIALKTNGWYFPSGM